MTMFTPQAQKGAKEILTTLLEKPAGLTIWELAKLTKNQTSLTQDKQSALSRPVKKLDNDGYLTTNGKKYLLTFKGFITALTIIETGEVPEAASIYLRNFAMQHQAILEVTRLAYKRQRFRYESGILNMYQLTAKSLLSEGFNFKEESGDNYVRAVTAHILNNYVNSREDPNNSENDDVLIGFFPDESEISELDE